MVAKNNENVNDELINGIPPTDESINEEDSIYLNIDEDGSFYQVDFEQSQEEIDSEFIVQGNKKQTKKRAATLKKTEKILNEQVKGDKKEPTAELGYARALSVNTNLAVQLFDENVAMYEWQGSFWSEVSKHAGKARAFEWLEKNFPEQVGNKLSGNAYESALFKLQALPPKPSENIIPLSNVWIFVDDSGKLQIKQPDKAWGVTYTINAALKHEPEQQFYEPSILPATSLFSKYLTSSLPDEKERDLVQEYCGYTLINSVRFQVAQIWEGEGSNGKSVLLYLIEQLHEKAIAVELDDLEGFELAPFRNASLAISAETPKGRINENILKKFIAGDLVKLKTKFKTSFDYHPTAKWIMSCNRFPKISDESDGVFRRLQYIRWNEQFKGKDIIRDLEKKIAEQELAIVLDWCLAGLKRLLERGEFAPPESVTKRIKQEKIASNSVHAFVDETGYRTDNTCTGILKEDLYKNYQEYCEAGGLTIFGGVEFWKRIRTLFPKMEEGQKKVNGKNKRLVKLTIKTLEEIQKEQDEVNKQFG